MLFHHVQMMLLAVSWILSGLSLPVTLEEWNGVPADRLYSFTSLGLHCEYGPVEQHLRPRSQIRRTHDKLHGQWGLWRHQRTDDQG